MITALLQVEIISAFTVLTAVKFTLTVFSMPAVIICVFCLEIVQQINKHMVIGYITEICFSPANRKDSKNLSV